MKKFFKVVAVTLITLIFLLTSAAFIASKTIDPNKHKTKLSLYVFSKTGQLLVINGKMQWSFFPWIGLKATNLTYYNPPAFKPEVFLTSNEMDIKVKLLPLIQGKIEVKNITLDNVVVNLVTDRNGRSNWQSLVKNDSKQNTHSTTPDKTQNLLSTLSVHSFAIKNGQLNYFDQTSNHVTQIRSLNIHSNQIQLGKPFPLSLQFELLNQHHLPTISFDSRAKLLISQDRQRYDLTDVKMKGKYSPNTKSVDFNSNGQLVINLQQHLLNGAFAVSLSDLQGQVKFQGNILSKRLHVGITANELNLDDYLSDSKDESREQPKSKNSSPSPWIITGQVHLGNLNFKQLNLTQISANFKQQNQVLQFSPINANLYGGQLTGSIVVDKRLQNKTAIILKPTISQMDMANFLHTFSSKDKLHGKANIVANLSATTDAETPFLAALNGTAKLTLQEGSIKGLDVIYQLSRAHAFIKHLTILKINNSKQTEFRALTATTTIKNGIISSDDLQLSSDYLQVSGRGETNLLTKGIHYRLNALAQPKLADNNNVIGKEATQYQVPIKITGTVTQPDVNLDYAELAKLIYKEGIRKQIDKHVVKNLDHLKENLTGKLESKLGDLAPTKLLGKLTGHSDTENAADVVNHDQETATE